MTGLSTRDTVAAALDYVEDHISESLTLRSIADAAFTSPSHLRRLFVLVTGEPLMTYVRLRRLSRSLDTLLATDMRVIDIAHEFGFSCEQAYIRAFRAAFGVAPGSLRRSRQEVIIREPIDAYQLSVAGDGLLYGPTFVKVPSFHVAGRLHRISESENLDLKAAHVALDFFTNDRGAISNAINPPVYIGLTRYPPGATDWSHYLAGVQVNAPEPLPAGFAGDTFPTSTCARFRYVGEHPYRELSIPTMRVMYDRIGAYFHREQTRYTTDFDLFFERVDTAVCDEHTCQMDWLTPVVDNHAKMSNSVKS